MDKYTNASAATWARTICLIVALLNSLLASFNKSPLPIDNEQLQQLVSTLIPLWWPLSTGGRTTPSPRRPSRQMNCLHG